MTFGLSSISVLVFLTSGFSGRMFGSSDSISYLTRSLRRSARRLISQYPEHMLSSSTLSVFFRETRLFAYLACVVAAVSLSVCSTSARIETNSSDQDSPTKPRGMVWIPAGEFVMGGVGNEARRDEFPRHTVKIDGFWIDETEVTNAQFASFVAETGYKTTAERAVDWEELKKDVPSDTPKPSEDQLSTGSLIFSAPAKKVGTSDYTKWWQWRKGADWRHPEGPDSSIEGLESHPVVHVSFFDAEAYCKWAGKRLPTEAEWEYAARGGLKDKPYCWGDDKIDATRANTWQGLFPTQNTAEDGYLHTAPVRSFPANGFGLYDMAGNVWEWCADRYRPSTYLERKIKGGSANGALCNPEGPAKSYDPRHPFAHDLRVQRGGSFLCHASYCSSYRPSARMSSTPDSAACHVGFRCVK